MRIVNRRNQKVLADRCELADSLVRRTVGLMMRRSLPSGEGLLLRPEHSVHCFFMRIPIDVLFLNADGRVLKIYAPLKPWRVSSIVRGAKQALELPAGIAASTDTQVGDVLLLEQRAMSNQR